MRKFFFICIFIKIFIGELNISQINDNFYNNILDFERVNNSPQYYQYSNLTELSPNLEEIYVTFEDERYFHLLLNSKQFVNFFYEPDVGEYHKSLKSCKFHLKLYNGKCNIDQIIANLKELIKTNGIVSVYPAYDKSNSTVKYASNTIIFKPKSYVNLNVIQEFFKINNANITNVINFGYDGIQVVASIEKGYDVFKVAKKLYETGYVIFAQPNFHYQSSNKDFELKDEKVIEKKTKKHTIKNNYDVPTFTPNDPRYSEQWYLNTVKIPEAWTLERGGFVTVALLDGEGVNYNHEDLGLYPNGKVRDPWNVTTDPPSSNVLPRTTDGKDSHGHYIAGILAAKTNNGVGIAGVGFDNYVMPVIIADNNYTSNNWTLTPERIAMACSYVLSKVQSANIVVMNCSWQYNYDESMRNSLLSVRNARPPKGISIVVSVGNNCINSIPFPANLDFVVAVGATEEEGLNRWTNHDWWLPGNPCTEGSNYGTELDIMAPGEEILTTDVTSSYGGSDYTKMTGTSFASPIVAASIGLMFSYQITVQAGPLHNSIYLRAQKVGECEECANSYGDCSYYPVNNILWNCEMGYGILNVESVINNHLMHVPINYTDCTPGTRVYGQGDKVLLEAYNDLTLPCENNINWRVEVKDGGALAIRGGHMVRLLPGFSAQALNNVRDTWFKAYIYELYDENDIFLQDNNFSQYSYLERLKVDKNDNLIPKQFALYQNYPNPFNPETQIKFDVPKASNVKISVYDIIGREVSVLVNSKMEPGVYNASWNASPYSSGVYFYRLVADDFVSVKKMVMIK